MLAGRTLTLVSPELVALKFEIWMKHEALPSAATADKGFQ